MVPTQKVDGKAPAAFGEAVAIMARLRAPGGLPWDREQDFDSIKRHTLEETYEVFDAIERRAWPDLRDELGDLLLQVLFYAQMAKEAGHFSIGDVVEGLNAKLIRRHPHVFGEADGKDSETVLRNWEQIKKEEKAEDASRAQRGLLDDVPRSMPATLEAQKLGSRAAKIGFDWPDAQGLFSKMDEELSELRNEVDRTEQVQDQIVEELGDLMFTAVNLARHLKVDPEGALRSANAKFRSRFAAMERSAGGSEALAGRGPEELEALWAEAKQAEAAR